MSLEGGGEGGGVGGGGGGGSLEVRFNSAIVAKSVVVLVFSHLDTPTVDRFIVFLETKQGGQKRYAM